METRILVKKAIFSILFILTLWCGYGLFQMWLESSLVGNAVSQLQNGLAPYAIQRYVAAGRMASTVFWAFGAVGMGIVWIPVAFKLVRKGE